jgi:hypothetical protein
MDYPNSGLLLTNTRKVKDTAPDMTGDIKFERDYLISVLDGSEGEEVVIKLSAWLKKDKAGNRMVSLKVDSSVKPVQVKDPWDD